LLNKKWKREIIEIRGVECFKQSQMYINGVLIEAWRKLKAGDLSGARLDLAKVETVVVLIIESYKVYIERRGDNIVVRLFTCTSKVVYLNITTLPKNAPFGKFSYTTNFTH
jgi:hypothetical protein